jgi:hypothetical protein
VAGQTVGNWRAADDQTYDVKVRLAPEARDNPDDLERLPVLGRRMPTARMRIVRLNQVADVRAHRPNQINRRDLNRESRDHRQHQRPRTGRGVGRHPPAWRPRPAARLQLPLRRRHQGHAGQLRLRISALVMGVVFIYMILASQFRSFLQPLALMSSLPLTLIGVVLALLLWRSTLNMFSIIGVVMLMGLVTKNAILLVDFAIRARRARRRPHRGRPRASEALLLAAKVRLRPILMTTLAMIFGMVPLAFALTEGSEQRAPMGQAVIGGVITSSLLTLVVVPVIYCWLDDLARVAQAPLFGGGAGGMHPSACATATLESWVYPNPRRRPEPTMNVEQARFNMIEQQIRPWEVLDPTCWTCWPWCGARTSCRRPTARWPSSTRGAAGADGQVHAGAQGRGPAAAGRCRCSRTSACWNRRRLGLHGRAAGAPRPVGGQRWRSARWPPWRAPTCAAAAC